VRFKINQRLDIVTFGEPLGEILAMLIDARIRLLVTPVYSVPHGALARM
jgi:hypothetical protein